MIEVKSTEEIIASCIDENTRNEYSVLSMSMSDLKRWVNVDTMISHIKVMRELWNDDNLNEDDFKNLIKELEGVKQQ